MKDYRLLCKFLRTPVVTLDLNIVLGDQGIAYQWLILLEQIVSSVPTYLHLYYCEEVLFILS